MPYSFNKPLSKKITYRFLFYEIAAILLILLHIVGLNFIDINGIIPDFLTILIVWIALSEGQFIALFAAFLIGLQYDVLSIDVLGTNALSKTFAAFVAGFFYSEKFKSERIGSFYFLPIVFVTAFVHNIIYYFFYIRASSLNFVDFFLEYGLWMSVYTTLISVIAVFIKMPKKY